MPIMGGSTAAEVFKSAVPPQAAASNRITAEKLILFIETSGGASDEKALTRYPRRRDQSKPRAVTDVFK
jgi:hypothetical protein